jgi:hypothetical protein
MSSTRQQRRLSKSRLIDYRQCAKRLWLQVHRPDLRAEDPSARMRMDIGNDVGELARKLVDPTGEGILFDAQRDGYDAVFEASRAAVPLRRPLFEAGFTVGLLFAFVDLLLPASGPDRDSGWTLVEVKSAASFKPYHLDDLAVQVHILDEAGVPLNGAAIACIDSSWTYPGGGHYAGLLRQHNRLEEARSRSSEVRRWTDGAQSIIQEKGEPDVATGDHCTSPFPCPFFDHCSAQSGPRPVITAPVEWLPRVQTKALKARLADPAIVSMEQVADELLNDLQRRVKAATLSGRPYTDSVAALRAVEQVQWPLFFLDFESVNLAIPRWAGTRPFEQVPFQYSLHILHQNGTLEHREFIDLSGNDPRRPLTERLIADIPSTAGGTVFAYNSSFETRVLKHLADTLGDLKLPLNDIIRRIKDLLPIARDTWYHPDQQGSWSIKRVLPTLGERSASYADLDGVSDGQQAILAYSRATSAGVDETERESIRRALIRYCAQDTEAMVILWRHLGRIADTGE